MFIVSLLFVNLTKYVTYTSVNWKLNVFCCGQV